ncbi:MAG: hypothetical protein EBV03_04085 [Proteobacteria bacterium]|nr:hypothetical protein [Pseudomonadota bacterium]
MFLGEELENGEAEFWRGVELGLAGFGLGLGGAGGGGLALGGGAGSAEGLSGLGIERKFGLDFGREKFDRDGEDALGVMDCGFCRSVADDTGGGVAFRTDREGSKIDRGFRAVAFVLGARPDQESDDGEPGEAAEFSLPGVAGRAMIFAVLVTVLGHEARERESPPLAIAIPCGFCNGGSVKVRKRSDGCGWMVDGMIDGRRVRLTFPTKDEADGARARLMARKARAGDKAALVPPETVAAWMRLEERCVAAGGTLAGAVEYWLQSRPGPGTAKLTELLPKWLLEKDASRGSRHVDQVAIHWKDWMVDAAAWLGPEAAASEATAAHVRDHVQGHGWTAATIRNRLASLSCVFGWAVRHGLCAANPVTLVPRPELPVADEVRFLSIPEARRLLRGVAARPEEDRDLMAYLALALFAGIRRAELLRAMVRDIDFDAGEFVVPLGKLSAKIGSRFRSRKRRVVIMEKACREWLRWAGVDRRQPGERLILPNFRRRWDAAKVVLSPWPSNVLRHTFPTYHYAWYRNEAELQAILGHDSPDVLVEHYRGLARRADAEAFLSLSPGTVLDAAGA